MWGEQLFYQVDSTEKEDFLLTITDRQGKLSKVNSNIPVVLIAEKLWNLLPNDTREMR